MWKERLLKTIRPSPFKVGAIVVVLAVVLYEQAIFRSEKGVLRQIINSLDNRVTDIMFRYRGRIKTTDSVVIVDIDDRSLQEPPKGLGQWPWPRIVIADLLRKLTDSGAKVMGFDVVFAEKDRTSPRKYIRYFKPHMKRDLTEDEQDALDWDMVLSEVLDDTPTVMGYVFIAGYDGLADKSVRPWPNWQSATEPPGLQPWELGFRHVYRAITNNVTLAELLKTEGFFNTFPDASGMVRKVPLFLEMNGLPFPALALEMLRMGMGEKKLTIHTTRRKRTAWHPTKWNPETGMPIEGRELEQYEVAGVTIGNTFIPTDERGEMYINYRGPGGRDEKTFPYVPAVRIIKGAPQALAAIKDKYVLIGSSAPGLLDLRATPFSNSYPGVECHANLIDNILAKDFLRRDRYQERDVALGVIIVGGLVLAALLAFAGPIVGGSFGALLLAALAAGNYYVFFLNGVIMGLSFPLLSIIAVFLAVALSSYLFEGRQKRYIANAFSLYLSPTLVDRVAADPEALKLEGEQKELTVLFSDIRGFTSISEKMQPQELSSFLNEYLTPMSEIVMATEGTVDKFIGDAVVAFWNAPLDVADHPRHAARAALQMIRKLAELQRLWDARGLPPINIGIGLNTGTVSVGNMGSERRFDYTVMGDNVNLASRLEGLNKIYGTTILISESTRRAIGESFFARRVDVVRVKGKEEPVPIYELLFEGAPDATRREEADLFAQAFAAYQAQKWDEAEAKLQALRSTHDHYLYGVYEKRIQTFRHDPPPTEWDGVYTHTEK